MPDKKNSNEVTVEQIKFGGLSSDKRRKRKVGRHLKYDGDPKVKKSVTIRKSCLDIKPKNMQTTEYLEKCVASSAFLPPERARI